MATIAALPASRDPALLPRIALTALALALLWPAVAIVEFDPRQLVDPKNLSTMARFLGTFFPMALSADFLDLVARTTIATVALATAGTALAIVIGFPLAVAVSGSLSVSRIGPARGAWIAPLARAPLRGLLIFMRSIPEIVWALLFVRAVGLGPAAGVLAIGIAYGGVVGKVFTDLLEGAPRRRRAARPPAGGRRTNAFLYGVLPVALP